RTRWFGFLAKAPASLRGAEKVLSRRQNGCAVGSNVCRPQTPGHAREANGITMPSAPPVDPRYRRCQAAELPRLGLSQAFVFCQQPLQRAGLVFAAQLGQRIAV